MWSKLLLEETYSDAGAAGALYGWLGQTPLALCLQGHLPVKREIFGNWKVTLAVCPRSVSVQVNLLLAGLDVGNRAASFKESRKQHWK